MPSAPLRRLRLRNFRSFREAETSFGPLTFLVGRNGAGKSNVLEAFRFLHEVGQSALLRNVLASFNGANVGYRGEPSGLMVAAEFATSEGACELTTYLEDDWSQADAVGRILAQGSSQGEAFRALNDANWLDPDPEMVSGIFPYFGGGRLAWDGQNAAAVYSNLSSEAKASLTETLRRILPAVGGISTGRIGQRSGLEFTLADRTDLDAASMSAGTLRAFALLLGLAEAPDGSILMIEEPERGLHPGALAVLFDEIRAASRRLQIIATTQSPDLLDNDWVTADMLRLVVWRDGASVVSAPSSGVAEVLRRQLDTAGGLLRTGELVSGEP